MQEFTKKQIEKYLLGKLKGSDLTSFESQLKTDTALAEEVKIQRLLMEQVESLGALELKEQLLGIKKDLEGKRKVLIRRMLGLGAAAAIALLVFGVQFLGTDAPAEDLFDNYYAAYELPFATRSGKGEELLGQAGVYYLGKDYRKALPVLEEIIAENPKDSRSRLALGISQMEMAKEQEALKSFAVLIENNDPLYLDQARWYTALIHLKNDQKEACRKQLILLIGNPRAPHYTQAQDLLKKLEI